jgi:hypothetical protein
VGSASSATLPVLHSRRDEDLVPTGERPPLSGKRVSEVEPGEDPGEDARKVCEFRALQDGTAVGGIPAAPEKQVSKASYDCPRAHE